MKGMVFTEFLEMVETTFSQDMVDDILDDANPPSGGAYTAVGTYDHAELVAMVVALSQRTGVAVPTLIKAFGQHLFSVFSKNYRQFFEHVPDAFTFLSGIEEVIHAQVIKLYPDADLPRFECQREGEVLYMTYYSLRHFADLAEGLILGCGIYFGENLILQRQEIDANTTRFVISKQ
ncbi:MAG: heme NO-binding domain-containing protein [Candidatus Methylumidiphilus sp.]